jgi:glycosyltransferase involved in cell wall biosynthesis
MSKSPFSVVIPVYNGEQVIGRALRSVIRQTRAPFEIIVVDDASTDRTLYTVSDVFSGEALPEGVTTRIVRREANGGVGAARNMGVETGDTPAARRYFLKAALQEPTRIRWWGMAAAAWGGRPVFRAIQTVKRAVLSLG